MTRKEIIAFIEQNQGDRLVDYYNKIYEKLKDLNKKNDRISFFLIAIVVTFYLISITTITSIQIGPFNTTDLSLIPKLTPLLFSYFLFEFAIVNAHRAELLKTMKWISLSIFNHKLDMKDMDDNYYNYFTRLLLPFSIWVEISKLNDSKNKMGCLGALLFIPILTLFFLPFIFEYFAIRNVILLYWDNYIGKVSVVLSIWLLLIVIYFYFKVIVSAIQASKQDSQI